MDLQCDYVDGHPSFRSGVQGGRMVITEGLGLRFETFGYPDGQPRWTVLFDVGAGMVHDVQVQSKGGSTGGLRSARSVFAPSRSRLSLRVRQGPGSR